MKNLITLALSLVFFLSLSTYAFKVSNIYQAEIPLDAQTEAKRASAIKEGFAMVLKKASGDSQVVNHPIVNRNLEKADNYVQEYSYLPGTTSFPYLIQIKYNPIATNRLLKKAGFALWGKNRPLILVWLTVTMKDHATEIISNEDTSDLLQRIKAQAKESALPIIFPVMDVSDLNIVSIQEILNQSLPLIKEASKRYSPDALLVGKIAAAETGYQSQWQLILGDREWHFSIAESTPETVALSTLKQVSQTLAKHYLTKEEKVAQAWVKLQVSNISQPDDLAKLTQYLTQLSSVKQVRLQQVSGDVVELTLLIRNTVPLFLQNAALDQRLLLKSQDDNANVLVFEWAH